MRPTSRLVGASLFGLLLIAPPMLAQELAQCATSRPAKEDVFALDLDALMNVNVTTASKSFETLSDAAGVISVITPTRAARSGGTTPVRSRSASGPRPAPAWPPIAAWWPRAAT